MALKMNKRLDPLIILAEALHQRNLASFSTEDRKITALKDERKELDSQIMAARTYVPESLNWPGAQERWHHHLQLKAARLQAYIAEAEKSADWARAQAQRSFGRTLVLERISKFKG